MTGAGSMARGPAPPADGDGERLLRGLAAAGDGAIPLAEAALALAARERQGADPARYRDHLASLTREVGAAGRGARNAAARVAALNATLVASHGYAGDHRDYDDLQNADLMHVIDRRKGLPVALGILYIHAARAQGWPICGLAFPGHFLLRLDHAGERAIIDPFNGGAILEPEELRELLKATGGREAELAPEHYAPAPDRDILLRLQNNLKIRLMRSGDAERALAIVEGMLLFAPDRAALWHEAAALNAHLGHVRAAIGALESFLEREAMPAARRQAAALLQQLKGKLN